MKIHVENQQFGGDILARLQRQFANREAVLKSGDTDDLFWWDLLQDPARLDESFSLGETLILDAKDVRLLSEGRLTLLRHAADHRWEPMGHMARHLKRALPNVQRDVEILAKLGLIRKKKSGQETLVAAAGQHLHIDLLA